MHASFINGDKNCLVEAHLDYEIKQPIHTYIHVYYVYIYIAVYLYDKQPPLGRSIAGSICKDGTNIIKEKTNCVNECFNSLYIYV